MSAESRAKVWTNFEEALGGRLSHQHHPLSQDFLACASQKDAVSLPPPPLPDVTVCGLIILAGHAIVVTCSQPASHDGTANKTAEQRSYVFQLDLSRQGLRELPQDIGRLNKVSGLGGEREARECMEAKQHFRFSSGIALGHSTQP